MDLFLQNIARHVLLSDTEQDQVMSFTERQVVPARTVLLENGKICTHSFFVCSGILRSYSVDQNGQEHVVSFASPGWFIADMYSFLTQRPGHLFIETNEESEVLSMSKENQEKLYVAVPKMERFFRILVENSLVANQQRLIDNLTFTAEARYDKFAAKHRDLVHILPQKQIASYLGITPEFFSRMKARRLKKQ